MRLCSNRRHIGRLSGLSLICVNPDPKSSPMSMHNPPHPGLVLREWLSETTVTEAARSLGVTRAMLSRILNGASAISAEMALRLSRALGTSPGLWIGMQVDFDLWQANRVFKANVHRIRVPTLRRSGTSQSPKNSRGNIARSATASD